MVLHRYAVLALGLYMGLYKYVEAVVSESESHTALLEDALKYAQAQGRAASGKVFEYRGVLIDAN